jgi:antitoxin component of RelBE/YafQ-DinJ toxin-antitoxin module
MSVQLEQSLLTPDGTDVIQQRLLDAKAKQAADAIVIEQLKLELSSKTEAAASSIFRTEALEVELKSVKEEATKALKKLEKMEQHYQVSIV